MIQAQSIMNGRWLRSVLMVVSLILLLSYAGLFVVHLDDLYEIYHVNGIWMALARYRNEGILYPPLAYDGYYGGTRYMPLFFSVHSLIARLTGEYLASGRLTTLLSMALLFAGLVLAVRQNTKSLSLGVALASLILASNTGYTASLTIRADILSVAFAIFGLLFIQQSRCGSTFWGAVCFAMAFMAKFSAVAGPLAVVIVLAIKDKRRCAKFILYLALVLSALLFLVQVLSDGRFLVNFSQGGTGGLLSLPEILRTPLRLRDLYHTNPEYGLLIPLALFTLVSRLVSKRAGLWEVYFATAAVVTLGILLHRGCTSNHLIDIYVAAIVLVSQHLSPEAVAPTSRTWSLREVVLVCFIWLAFAGLGLYHTDGWLATRKDYSVSHALDEIGPGARDAFFEDPTLPTVLDQRPVVLDPVVFLSLAKRGVVSEDELVDRILNKKFSAVVLMWNIDSPEGQSWYRDMHFGIRVADAIRESYVLDKGVPPLYMWVYFPKDG